MWFLNILAIMLMLAGFCICIGSAMIGIDKAVRRNDPSYYTAVGVFIGIALLCGIGLGNML